MEPIKFDNRGTPIDLTVWRGSSDQKTFIFDSPFTLEDKEVTANIFNSKRPSDKTPLEVTIPDSQTLVVTLSEVISSTFPFNSCSWEILIKYPEGFTKSFVYGKVTLIGAEP